MSVIAAEPQLRDIVETIKREHALMMQASSAMALHAISIGDALIEAKRLVPPGEWTRWLTTNLPYERRRSMCRNYMRLAYLKEYVDHELSITANIQLLAGLEGRCSATPRVPADIKAEALRLHATGEFSNAAIARIVGTTKESVRCWTDPEYARHKMDQSNVRRRQRQIERRPDLVLVTKNDRAFKYGEPGRAAVGRAVRQLAQVQGKDATREACLDLAEIARAWASRLGAVEGIAQEPEAA